MMSIIQYYNEETKTLALPHDFNEELENLPSDIKVIIFGDRFNNLVDNLPDSITHLIFGFWFNQPVSKLPKTITHLTFGYWFNKTVSKLPNSITHLTFGMNFNQSIDKLPTTIIELGFYSNSKIKNNIPNNIEYINIIFFNNDKYNEAIENLPINVKQIKISEEVKIHYLKKIPFGCKVVDELDNEIFL